MTSQVFPRGWCMLAGLLFLTGCGDGMVRVKGKVFLDDVPLSGGSVNFQPKDATTGRPAVCPIAPDGTFVAATLNPDDGLTPGEFTIAIVPPPQGAPAEKRINVSFPAKYRDGTTSGFTADVKKGSGPVWLDLKMTSK